MNVVNYSQSQLPKIKKSTTLPESYAVTFVITDKPGRLYYDSAVKLMEHIEIIEESRSLIRKGKTMTWVDLKKVNAKKNSTK